MIIAPEILVGKPVIKVTRQTVEYIIGLFAQSWTEDDILRNYPGLQKNIQACLPYASELLKVEKVYTFQLNGY